jgi:serine/threonine-protein kinase
MEVALSHQYQSLPPLPPAVPLPVAALVAELTARDPAGRPADAGAVAARAVRLRDAMDGAATQDGPWLASAGSWDERWSAATQAEQWLATPADEGDIRYGALPAARPGRPGETQLEGATLREIGLHNAGMYEPEPPGPRGARRRGRRHAARGHTLLVLAAAAVAVIVGLTGWMLVSGASSGAPPAPRHSAAARPRATTPLMVTVPADLAGQPYRDVVQQLQGMGLKVKLKYAPSDQDHGTVVSVSPVGPVALGSTVMVTVAARHHHDGGDGNGNGGGQ